jgi:hypothetical protein
MARSGTLLAQRLLILSCARGENPRQLSVETHLRPDPEAVLERLETIKRGEEMLQRLREVSQHTEERVKQVLSKDEVERRRRLLSKHLSSASPQPGL